VERSLKPNRACAVAAAAAHDFNDELTIIFSSVSGSLDSLEAGHPARRLLLDARSAAQRCAWKTYGLLQYTARSGVQPVRTSLEALLR
jgi:hypothetical protein